ncbi:MAG: hypothetical protein M3409_07365, partial [Gemmatimonadota bacterium]|nr:hypothetical protein [Gemmatimonadota bacterium]
VYATRSDSAGGFVLRRIPESGYRLRAFLDANRNRELDPFEARDSQQVQVAGAVAAPVLLRLLLPDTTPPVPASARLAEAGIELRLDDFLDPAQPLVPGQLRVTGPDGRVLPVEGVRLGSAPAGAPADTPAAAAPLPSQSLFVTLREPLAPNTSYRIRVSGVRNLNGLVGGGEVELRTPAAPPPGPAAAPRP